MRTDVGDYPLERPRGYFLELASGLLVNEGLRCCSWLEQLLLEAVRLVDHLFYACFGLALFVVFMHVSS